MNEGVKYDGGKRRFSLLPWRELGQVVDAFTRGAVKYTKRGECNCVRVDVAEHHDTCDWHRIIRDGSNNWKTVEGGRERYFDALHRHLDAWWDGEKIDKNTGLPHLACATCCLFILAWLDNNAASDGTVTVDADGRLIKDVADESLAERNGALRIEKIEIDGHSFDVIDDGNWFTNIDGSRDFWNLSGIRISSVTNDQWRDVFCNASSRNFVSVFFSNGTVLRSRHDGAIRGTSSRAPGSESVVVSFSGPGPMVEE